MPFTFTIRYSQFSATYNQQPLPVILPKDSAHNSPGALSALPYSAGVVLGARDDGVAVVVERATENLVSMALQHLQHNNAEAQHR